jgi:hypothetical protein
VNIIQKIIIEPVKKSLENIIVFLPNILTSFLLFILGIGVSLLVKVILERFFKAIGLDRFSASFGFHELLKKGGIKDSLSVLLAKFTGGMIFLIFTLLSMKALEIMIVEKLIEKFLFYLPNIVIALLILVLGWLFGNFLGRAVLIAAVNAGMKFSRFMATFVKYLILILAVTMALEHVGIGKETVEITFAVLFSGMVFAVSLAFGLGGKDIAKKYLEKKIGGEQEQNHDGINHL